MSPTERSLRHLRESGWTVCIVEKWIPGANLRKDAFEFGDLLGCKPDARPTLFQVTSGSNVAARIMKAKEHAGPLTAWLLSGGRLVLHGWAKRGPRGERKRWTVREVELGIKDLKPADGGIQHDDLTDGPAPLAVSSHPAGSAHDSAGSSSGGIA